MKRCAWNMCAGALGLGMVMGMVVTMILAGVCLAAEETAGETAGETAAEAAAATFLLRYQWRAGEAFSWDVTHRNRTVTMVAGQTSNVDTYAHSEKCWEVESVDASGVATILNSVPWADMRELKEDGTMNTFDSRKEMVATEGFETLPASLGRTLAKIRINPRGEQVSREDFQTTTIVQQANQAYVCIVFPEEAVPVGHSWTKTYPVYVPTAAGTLRRVDMIQRFTLTRVENGIATITYSTRVLTPLQERENDVLAQIMDRLYVGTFLFDVERGRAILLTQKVDQKVFGFRGDVSSLKILIEFNERLLF